MSLIARKLGTLRRVVRSQGRAGVMAVVKEKLDMRPFLQPPLDYARLAPSALPLLARHGAPRLLINAIGAGVGDDLLLTVMYHELRVRGQDDFWVTTRHPQLYAGNEDIPRVVPPLDRYDRLLKRFGTRVVYPWYTSYHPAYDRDDPMPEQHIIAIMCQKAGITGSVTLKPRMFLSDEERAAGQRVPMQVAIQSAGLDAKHAMTTKNWHREGYQEVVDALRSTVNFVQVGSRHDPPLHGALDLRGTTSLRETAAVLANSIAFVGQVGFLMHLARSVDCRSVIVYGGRETPEQSGYPCNVNLYSPVACSPCWRLNSCPFDRVCLQMVAADDVIHGLEQVMQKRDRPLETDTHVITPEQIARTTQRYEDAAQMHQLAWSVLYR
ncbi:MAG TPA: glycosyltransferase family 9 protein [Gemmatimonadaceae bacterium]|nr:glycosyltransferase family 9 protein [Gemmatimonadaceae bacterium]